MTTISTNTISSETYYNENPIKEENCIKSPLIPIDFPRNVFKDNPNMDSLKRRTLPLNDLLYQFAQNKNKNEDAQCKINQRQKDPHCDKKNIAIAAICTLVSTAILVGSIALVVLIVISIPPVSPYLVGLAIFTATAELFIAGTIMSIPLTMFSVSVLYLYNSIKESKRNPEKEIEYIKNEKADIKNRINQLDKDSINAINEIIEICNAKIKSANLKNFDSRGEVNPDLHNNAIRLKNNLENIKSRFKWSSNVST